MNKGLNAKIRNLEPQLILPLEYVLRSYRRMTRRRIENTIGTSNDDQLIY